MRARRPIPLLLPRPVLRGQPPPRRCQHPLPEGGGEPRQRLPGGDDDPCGDVGAVLLAVPDDHALHGAPLLHDPRRRRHADASADGRAQVKLTTNLL